MRAMTIYLSENEALSNWIRKEINSMTNQRYKYFHIAEDMGVNPAQLYRFMQGKRVSSDMIDGFIKLYTRNL